MSLSLKQWRQKSKRGQRSLEQLPWLPGVGLHEAGFSSSVQGRDDVACE